LLGWVIANYGDLELRCLQVRRTAEGRYAVGFPSRTDSNGVMHPIVRPLDQMARAAIEAQVLGELRRRGLLPRESQARPNRTSRSQDKSRSTPS